MHNIKFRTRWKRLRSRENGIYSINEDDEEVKTPTVKVFEKIITVDMRIVDISYQAEKLFNLTKLVRLVNTTYQPPISKFTSCCQEYPKTRED